VSTVSVAGEARALGRGLQPSSHQPQWALERHHGSAAEPAALAEAGCQRRLRSKALACPGSGRSTGAGWPDALSPLAVFAGQVTRVPFAP
jgi:hypothetical protein